MNSTGLSDQKLTVLSSVYVSCLSFSLIGSCSVVVVSVVKRRRLNEQAKPLFQLALADFLASLFLMTATIMNFLSYNAVPEIMVLCSDGLPLSLTFYCISFFLVIIYARESAYAAQGWREQPQEVCRDQRVPAEPVPSPALSKIWCPLTGMQSFLLKRLGRRWITNLLYISAWLLPLMGYVIYIRTISLTAVPLIPTQSHNLFQEEGGSTNARFCNSCILFLHLHIEGNFCVTVDPQHNDFIRGFTFVSVLAVLICSSLVYWKLQSWHRHYELVSLRSTGRVWSSAAYMILVIIFCWTPALILISLSFALSETERLFPLFIIQAMSVSLQGFLNSIVYGWRRRNFREAVLGERLALLAYSNRAFFDQSLVVESGAG